MQRETSPFAGCRIKLHAEAWSQTTINDQPALVAADRRAAASRVPSALNAGSNPLSTLTPRSRVVLKSVARKRAQIDARLSKPPATS